MKKILKFSNKILSTILALAIIFCLMPAVTPEVSAAGYSNGYVGNPGGDGKGILAYGMDVSKWQGTNVDFAKAKAGGIDFVIIRAGYRNSTDSCFEHNYAAAKAAGLDVGAYWYSYALTEEEVLAEAKYCENLLKGKKFEYPIYFDFEDPSQQSLPKATKKTLCRTWMNYLASKNYLIGIYSSMSWLTGDLNPSTNTPEYETWMAKFLNSGSYATYELYHNSYGMWQYTDSGKVDGYSGNVDRSIAFRDYPSIVKKYGFNGYTAEPSTFTFKFMANGGTGTMANQKINYGTNTAISANQFTNEGYVFKGWYANRVADGTWRYTNGTDSVWCAKGEQPAGYYRYRYKDGQVVAKTGMGNADTVKLYAVWEGASYKVKYDANGGSGTMSNSTYSYGVESALSANTFTKSKCTFGGWSLTRKSDGKVRYILNSETAKWCVPGEQPDGYRVYFYKDQQTISALSNVEGDVVTLKAHWLPKTTGTTTFYFDFDANGGTGTMARQAIEKGVSTPINKCTFTKPGYKFKAWRAHRASDDKWRIKNEDGSAAVWALYGEQGSEYTNLGTYKDGVKVSSTSSVDCDIITLYAEWEEDFKFTFKFDANGGTGSMPDQTIAYGTDTAISKNTFTKPGYKFVGWNAHKLYDDTWRYTNGTTAGFYKEGSQPSGYDSLYIYKDCHVVAKTGAGLDDTVVLRAVWEEDFKFTFKFDANGGTGTMPNQLVTYGTNVPIDNNQFTRAGYKFGGWNAHRLYDDTWRYTDGTTSVWCKEGEQPTGYSLYTYKNQASVAKTGMGLDDTVVLRAVWEEDFKFTVKFDANGGTGTMNDVLVTYGINTTMPKSIFTRQGYKFSGWNCHRLADDTWRYTNGVITSAWYKEGEQPEGYSLFKYKDETTISKSGTGLDDVVIFRAVWEEDLKFTVKYFANGGSGELADQLITYNVSTPLSKNTFTRAGYKFAGWNAYRTADNTWRYTDGITTGWYQKGTQPEGYELSVYKDEAKVAKTGLGFYDVVNMYAVWEEIKYGDADLDGIVSIKDATEIQKFIAYETVINDELFELCDVNKDGHVNIKDVTLIQKYIAGLVGSLR